MIARSIDWLLSLLLVDVVAADCWCCYDVVFTRSAGVGAGVSSVGGGGVDRAVMWWW